MAMNQILFWFLIVVSLPLVAVGQNKELGAVDWLRNYDAALARSIDEEKPLLLLFQEVPGCQGCVSYGETTLSHPLIVDAIEEAFVPVAIFNNAGGHDRQVLERFKEPAWNFQVMRFLNTKSEDIIPRKDRVWQPVETAQRMIEALEKAEQPVPDYLQTVVWEGGASGLKTAAFSMFCFWDGEAKLGGIEGVIETEAGWMDGREVVKLRYDPRQVSWASLVRQAKAQGCAKHIYAPDQELRTVTKAEGVQLYVEDDYRIARASDQKRHLSNSRYRSLSLNGMQRTKVNAALSRRDAAAVHGWLSPSQR